MSAIDEAVRANREYAERFHSGDLALPPAKKLAIVACMDARMAVVQLLGLKFGDAHIIRNAGGVVTNDALRSLIISHHLLGTEEFMIVNHTDCGMLTFTDVELNERLENKTGLSPDAPLRFHSFSNLEHHVTEQIEKVKSHPWVPNHVVVRGFIYDVKTGLLNEVTAAHHKSA